MFSSDGFFGYFISRGLAVTLFLFLVAGLFLLAGIFLVIRIVVVRLTGKHDDEHPIFNKKE